MKESEFTDRTYTIPRLFAYGEDAEFDIVDSPSSGFSYKAGIPPMYSSRNGKKVNRKDINGFGRMVTQSSFFNQSGGYHTYNQDVSEVIGGYPLGAILYYYDASSNKVRCVRSMISDNKYDFVANPEYINGTVWSFVDVVVPKGFRPRVFPDFANNETGTLTAGDTYNSYLAKRPTLFIIQSGMDASKETTDNETGAYIWISVKRCGDDEFYSAGMLGYTAPVSALMNAYGRSAAMVEPDIEANANYTSFYSSSPIHIYLNTGDIVKITENREFNFSANFIAYPLMA